MEIVVARYNENLDWLREILLQTEQYDVKITIYNKGSTPAVIQNDMDDDSKLKFFQLQKTRVKTIQLPNVGVCDQTYLHHIVSRYNSLASSTLFLPGSAYEDETKRPRLLVLLQSVLSNMKTPEAEKTSVISIPWIFKSIYLGFARSKRVDSYECADVRNRDGNQDIHQSTLRPFGLWYDTHLKNVLGPAENITLKGMFLVGKTKLRKRSLEMYSKLLGMVSKHRFPEEAHYVERSWHAIINPTPQEEVSLLLVVPYIKEIIAAVLFFIGIAAALVLMKMKKPSITFRS